MSVERLLVLAMAITVSTSSPCGAQAMPQTPGQLLRFASGDSVEFLRTGPIVLASGQTGFVFSFHPFVAIDDTARLRAVAGEIWGWLRTRLDSNPPPFVVLSATTARVQPFFGIHHDNGFNFVVERHPDGVWYFSNETKPAK